MTTTDIDRVLEVAARWVGYLEKSMCEYAWYEQLRTGAGAGNFTRFGRIADLVIGRRDKRSKDGYAWCCSFLLACIYESRAGHVETTAPEGSLTPCETVIKWMEREIGGGMPLAYHAGCAAWYGTARRCGGITSVPARGHVILYLDQGGKPYHIGIVDSVNADGSVTTIEGNTNLHGPQVDPNGGAVARKRRALRKGAQVFLNFKTI
jgi:hypothetical protein